MTTKILIFLTLSILLTGCFLQSTDPVLNSMKTSALAEWELIYEKANFHQGALKDMRKIIKRADTNIPVLVEISQLISAVPFHTMPLLHIAEYASQAKNDEIDFLKLAELSIIKLSDTQSVEKLAKMAADLEKGDDLSEFNRRYTTLRETADAETVDEAVEKVNTMIQKAKDSASTL